MPGRFALPVYARDKNPHTEGHQKKCIATGLKEYLYGRQVKRPFADKRSNLMFKGLLL